MTDTEEVRVSDANVEVVRQRLADRAALGLSKYGVTTERGDLSLTDWLTHLQEELMDAAVYTQAAIANADTLARQLAEANARTAMLEADRSRLTACPWRVQKGLTSHCQPPKRLREALDQAEAAERRAAEVEKDAARYRWLRQDAGFEGWGLPRMHPHGREVSGAALDQAIDAAIAAGEKGNAD